MTRLGAPGSTIWLRFLIRADVADTAGTLTGALNLNGAASGGTTKISFGDTGSSTNWCVARGTTWATAGCPSCLTR